MIHTNINPVATKVVRQYLFAESAIESLATEIYQEWAKKFNNNLGYVDRVNVFNDQIVIWWRIDLIEYKCSGEITVPMEIFCGNWQGWVENLPIYDLKDAREVNYD